MHATLKVSLSALIALSLAVPAMAQDNRRPTSGASSSGSSAAPRGGSSSSGSSGSGGSSVSPSGSGSGVRGGGTAVSRPSREPRASRRSGGRDASAGASVPSYSRPRGGNAVRGEAVDRGNNPLPPRGGNNYYYYPGYGYNGYYGSYYRPYYPLYTGFGFFYYDPYWGGYGPYYGNGAYYGGYVRDDDGDDRDYNIGSVRLKVNPADGEVFVDGLYRGTVDEFDGVFQRLKLEAGAHRLEIRADGYAPLEFDILVTPGETTTYRGKLRR
jgi:hypothetical protein